MESVAYLELWLAAETIRNQSSWSEVELLAEPDRIASVSTQVNTLRLTVRLTVRPQTGKNMKESERIKKLEGINTVGPQTLRKLE